MPHVLIACRFVVLTCRHAMAVVSLFERHSDSLCSSMNCRGVVEREIEDVFVVLVRNDDYMPSIIGPPARRYKRRHQLVEQYDVLLHSPHMLVLHACHEGAERTHIVGRRVVLHDVLHHCHSQCLDQRRLSAI